MANNQPGAPKAPTPTERLIAEHDKTVKILKDQIEDLKATSQRPAPGAATAAPPRATATPTATTQKGGWGMFAGTVFLVVAALFAAWAWMTYGRDAVQNTLLSKQTEESVVGKSDLSPCAIGCISTQKVAPAVDSGLQSPAVPQQVQPVADICNINCQKRLIEVHCGHDQSVMVSGIVTVEDFEHLLSNDKVCQVAPPPTLPPAPPKMVYGDDSIPVLPRHIHHHHHRKFIPPVVDYTPPADTNSPDEFCQVCDMFKRGQQTTYHQSTPEYTPVNESPSGGEVCFWALNRSPTAMVLHQGGGPATPGSHGLVSWNKDPGKWQQSRFYPGFVTRQICMPAKALNASQVVSLCGDVGYQDFRHDDMVVQNIIAARSSPENDPACIAGHECPAGLR